MEAKEEFLETLDEAWEALARANKKIYDVDLLIDEREEFSQIRSRLSEFYRKIM